METCNSNVTKTIHSSIIFLGEKRCKMRQWIGRSCNYVAVGLILSSLTRRYDDDKTGKCHKCHLKMQEIPYRAGRTPSTPRKRTECKIGMARATWAESSWRISRSGSSSARRKRPFWTHPCPRRSAVDTFLWCWSISFANPPTSRSRCSARLRFPRPYWAREECHRNHDTRRSSWGQVTSWTDRASTIRIGNRMAARLDNKLGFKHGCTAVITSTCATLFATEWHFAGFDYACSARKTNKQIKAKRKREVHLSRRAIFTTELQCRSFSRACKCTRARVYESNSDEDDDTSSNWLTIECADRAYKNESSSRTIVTIELSVLFDVYICRACRCTAGRKNRIQ